VNNRIKKAVGVDRLKWKIREGGGRRNVRREDEVNRSQSLNNQWEDCTKSGRKKGTFLKGEKKGVGEKGGRENERQRAGGECLEAAQRTIPGGDTGIVYDKLMCEMQLTRER